MMTKKDALIRFVMAMLYLLTVSYFGFTNRVTFLEAIDNSIGREPVYSYLVWQILLFAVCLALHGFFIALLLRKKEIGSTLALCGGCFAAIGGTVAYGALTLIILGYYSPTQIYEPNPYHEACIGAETAISAILFVLAISVMIALFFFAKRYPKCAKPLFICSAVLTALAIFFTVPLLPFLSAESVF